MSRATEAPPMPSDNSGAAHVTPEIDQISENISAVLDYDMREERKISGSQRLMENISGFIGRPIFLGSTLLFVLVWGLINTLSPRFGWAPFDPEPYHWPQGITGLCALLATGVVLSKQNRLAKLAEQRAHLDLKVTLLTEQKAAKLIELLEELRRDLPNVKDRHDSDAVALTQSMNPDRVVAALDERLAPTALRPGNDSRAKKWTFAVCGTFILGSSISSRRDRRARIFCECRQWGK